MGALSKLKGSIEIDHSGAKSAIEDVQGQAEDMGSSFESTGQRMQSAGKSMTAGVTAPLAAMGGAAAKTAADFEKSMQQSVAIMGDVSEAERNKLEKTAREVATSTSKSHEEAAQSYYYLASSGMDAAESMEAMPEVAALAEAGQMDMAEATDVATDTLSAFGMEASELSNVTDTMTGTVNRHNQTMQGLGSAMSQVAPVASGLGMSVEEVSAALGTMGDVGIKAEKAGTGLRSALSSLSNPTGATADAIDRLGLNVQDAEGNMRPLHDIIGQLEESGASTADVLQLFGNEAGPAMQALVDQGSDALRNEAQALSELDGETQKVAETQRNSLHGSLELLKSSVADLAIEFGSVLTPYIRQAADLATNLADRFSGLGKTTQTVIVAVGGVAAALGPLLIAFGALIGPLSTAVAYLGGSGLVAAIGSLLPSLGALVAPLSSLTAIVSGLLAPLTGLVGSMGAFGTAVLGVLGPIGLLVAAIGGIGYVLSENREIVRKFANQAIGKLKSVASDAATWLEANAPGLLKSAFKKIGEGIRFIVLDIYNAVTGNGDSLIKSMIIDAASWLINEGPGLLKRAAKLAFDAIMAAAKGLYQGLIGNSLIPDMFEDVAAYIKSTAVSLVKGAINGYISAVKTGFKWLYGTGENSLYGSVTSALSSIADWITDTGSSKVEGGIDTVVSKVESAAEWMTGTGDDTLYGDVTGMFGDLTNWLDNDWDIAGTLSSAFSAAGDAAAEGFRGAFNEVIPSSIDIPDAAVAAANALGADINGGSISLPQLDVGGRIRKTGRAVVHKGEQVMQADQVQRLENLANAADSSDSASSQSGGGGDTVVTIDLGNLPDDAYIRVKDLERSIKQSIEQDVRIAEETTPGA
ncbi:phage tail tape measure protein [Haloterrigena salifodinae]|uniref:Phage tail tape measure protein n=1 Tax=Haloterrigena salifodinae TaxID=2675099 RepID=A0A8T8DYB4_9EURY|nr:phage tail tape measure protein [Haloterrigena salifodinae]QRV14223.1 phage tail tape measure protein [Haloterrigena salifodinae]